MAILPATAVIIGVIVLQQIPTWQEAIAIGLVAGGVLTHREAKLADSDHSFQHTENVAKELPQ